MDHNLRQKDQNSIAASGLTSASMCAGASPPFNAKGDFLVLRQMLGKVS